jgi:hypothetical protein
MYVKEQNQSLKALFGTKKHQQPAFKTCIVTIFAEIPAKAVSRPQILNNHMKICKINSIPPEHLLYINIRVRCRKSQNPCIIHWLEVKIEPGKNTKSQLTKRSKNHKAYSNHSKLCQHT